MITDLYEVPDEVGIIDFLFLTGEILSARQNQEVKPSGKVVTFSSITKIMGTIECNGAKQSVLLNYVTKVTHHRKGEDYINPIPNIYSENALTESLTGDFAGDWNLSHYVISVTNEEEDTDTCIFCNSAFIGLEDKVSLHVIEMINRFLFEKERMNARKQYEALKFAKCSNGLGLIPKIESFERGKTKNVRIKNMGDSSSS
tara:strand:- start:52852 stop:53454 length:603 start_codon:yes stop_codon:yes gene_type:complete